MERHRTIHDKNRRNSYRIDISKVTEDVRIIIDDEEGNMFFDKVIPLNHIKGVKSYISSLFLIKLNGTNLHLQL